MMLNWPIYLAAIVTAILGYFVHSWDVDRIEARATKILAAQVQFDIKECESSKKPTKDDNEYYQKIIAQRDADIVELSKRPARCLYISGSANNSKGRSLQSDQGNGLPDSVLYRFSSFCETDRAGLEILQQHNEKVQCKLK